MLHYAFMRAAFMAALLISIVCGPVGWFLVLRRQSFASHALAHVGFAGATAALVVDQPALLGFGVGSVLSGVAMGAISYRVIGHDVIIGLVLSLAMGIGVLCLHFLTRSAHAAMSLLFGNILGVDTNTLWALFFLSAGCLVVLACIARPLLLATLQPEVAEAKGVSLRLINCIFLVLVAVATVECTQATGILLVFTLMVAPAAAIIRQGFSPIVGMVATTALAVGESWGGLVLSWYTSWPVVFWIAALGAVGFGISHGIVLLSLKRK
ncbi:MAG: metal ABC transporter permease [Acetobacter sp.]|nr:metal ABC transporter permease [Acetobacter sp.]